MEYRGYEYEIGFCHPKSDWGKYKGWFYVKSGVFGVICKETYADADKAAKRSIREFIKSIPKTKEEWIELLDKCLVHTGYEYDGSYLNEDMAWDVLLKAAKHIDYEVEMDKLKNDLPD